MPEQIRSAEDDKMFRGKQITLRHGPGELDEAMKSWARAVGAAALIAYDKEQGKTVAVWTNEDTQAV